MASSTLLKSIGLVAVAMMLFSTVANAQDDIRLLYNEDTGNVQVEIINPLIQLFSIETLGPAGNAGTGFLLFNNVDNSTVVGAPIVTPPANQDTIAFLDVNPFPVGTVDLGNILPPGLTFVSTDATDTLSSGTDAAGNSVGFGALSYTVSGTPGNPGDTDLQTAFTTVTGGICGDVDLNGVVNFLDIQPFIMVLASNGFQAEADCDEDGVVTFLDIQPFIDALAGN